MNVIFIDFCWYYSLLFNCGYTNWIKCFIYPILDFGAKRIWKLVWMDEDGIRILVASDNHLGYEYSCLIYSIGNQTQLDTMIRLKRLKKY